MGSNFKMKRPIFIILILSLGVVSFISFFFFSKKITEPTRIAENENQTIPSGCLDDSWRVDYEFELENTPLSDVNIFTENKNTQEIINSFQVENIRKNYHPIELHDCGVYVIRMFNFDPLKTKQELGYKAELWKYDYTGNGKFVLLFHEKINKDGEKIYKSYYGTDFRIDPNEKHIALEKWAITEFDRGGYVDEKDRSIVIKDLNTTEDLFTLPAKSITEQYPNIIGSFGMDEWTEDSRYFWGDIFDGAYSLAYFRIDTNTWKYDIFEAPDGAMGGMPLNINTGYLPIQPGLAWTGDAEFTQELKEQDRKEGKKSSLYLYSLFTKGKVLIEITDEPQFFFKPQWLSNTELEYELPSGERKVYNFNEEQVYF